MGHCVGEEVSACACTPLGVGGGGAAVEGAGGGDLGVQEVEDLEVEGFEGGGGEGLCLRSGRGLRGEEGD